MSHHFRLRKPSEVSVLTNKKVELAQKVIHAVSVLSIFAASAIVGIGFYEASRYPYLKDTQENLFKPVERPETATTDKFGGYKEVTSQATGYWYFTTVNEKNTLIDPLGNAFAMIGVNKARRVGYDDAAYRSQYKGRNSQWAKDTSLFLASLGMNVIGDRSEHTEFQKPFVQQTPYFVLGDFLSPEAPREDTEWPDPWSASFQQKAINVARSIARLYGDDPYFIGVKVSNESNINLRVMDGSENPWADWWHVLIDPQYEHTDAQAKWEELMALRYNNDISA
ncbi:MAG: hypothetical protein HYV34_04040, partial [Candidatus Kerfeldbacteria bacterium]|nr:hypothetical protein [Candidatus Kerfeldbacteria bacterium]